MTITHLLSIDQKCCCGRDTKVTADTMEVVLAILRQNGWVASTEDLRVFYRDGMRTLPNMSCSASCWEAREFLTAVERLVEEHFVDQDKLVFDAMMEHTPWALTKKKVGLLVQAIKDARPGTREKRLRRRKKAKVRR